jgi:hypothetical protein
MARRRIIGLPTKRLFRDPPGQRDMFEKSLEEELEAKRRASVECLGMTFENDEKRREYFLEKLREKLKDPEFRKIEGFPIGEDEDILALSDPPYYTACPRMIRRSRPKARTAGTSPTRIRPVTWRSCANGP